MTLSQKRVLLLSRVFKKKEEGMFLKRVVYVSSISFFSLLVCQTDQYRDPIAYRSGELVAELTFEAWIQASKGNRDAVVRLSEKMFLIAGNYASDLDMSFLQGYKSCLENKNTVEELDRAQVTAYQRALVLACHYYWIVQLNNALRTNTFEFLYDPSIEKEALERASIAVYGQIVPEVVQGLKNMLEHDRLGISPMARS